MISDKIIQTIKDQFDDPLIYGINDKYYVKINDKIYRLFLSGPYGYQIIRVV